MARVEKKAEAEGRTIVFIDESGVYLLPFVVRTYAPCGQTPIDATKRIQLEQLPGYAPELNPTEWVWSYLKVAELANTSCDKLVEIAALVQKARKRMQRKPELIQAFIRDAGYEV